MCEDLSAVLSALDNDYVPALRKAKNFSIEDVLSVVACMHAAYPDLHAFENGRVNAKLFEHFFMYMACKIDFLPSAPLVNAGLPRDHCVDAVHEQER